MNELLPVGSLILLKNTSKYIVIFGFLYKKKNKNEIYDYMGYLYPYGTINNNEKILFNHNEIDKVIFEGYRDEKWNSYKNKLLEVLNDKRKD